ncbi:MAG: M28 family peptidase [Planctomycetales bacterium]|nr:M28 family peptidase [Planctomycetales bacterium]MCA9169759.1 M28 family peptidase [Planctomycetales bacterium]
MHFPFTFTWRAVCCACLLLLPKSVCAETPWPTASVERVAESSINEATLRAHIRFLADDLLEGRAPGSRGDELAQRYTIAQFAALGLQPAAQNGWLQPVPLVGVTTRAPDQLTFRTANDKLELKRHDDYILATGRPAEAIQIEDAELVFVGYGIVAPEYDWDDYKGVDLRGKILVMMNNDPADDPQLFAGRTRLYYGRWDYKYEMAARQGAAGALIIHTTESAGYPYQVVQTSWSGEEFELREMTGPRLETRGWLTDESAQRIAELAGKSLDDLRRQAESRDFRPVPLGVSTSISLTARVRERDTANVLGLLPGSDASKSRETVIVMAHHDHIGMAESRDENGDNIYNGAVDNASGMATMLSLAKAFTDLPERPARSVLFAAVGAEEQGLLGSAYYAAHPTIPPGYLAAVVNVDGMNIWGKSRDVNVIGLGKSNLDELVSRVAGWQKRVVTPDSFPDRGYYYRSDQFSLAKIGVPGVYLHSGIHIIDRPDDWGRLQQEDWVKTNYHQPSDEYLESWDVSGGVQDAQLLFHTAWLIAQQADMPTWMDNDEFQAPRLRALEERRQQETTAGR